MLAGAVECSELLRVCDRIRCLLAGSTTDAAVVELAALITHAGWIRGRAEDAAVRAGAHELLKTLLDGAPDELRQAMGVFE